MTTDEKRKAVNWFCFENHGGIDGCKGCPVEDAENFFCVEYSSESCPEEIIDKWYERIFCVNANNKGEKL